MPMATLIAASVMVVFSGCATRDWVRDYVKQADQPVEARVAQVEQHDARMDARIGTLASDTAAARNVADEGVRKSEDVDKRVSQAIVDFNKLTLVESTELHYPAGRYSLDANQKRVLDDVNRKLAENPAYIAHIVGEADKPGRDQYNAELSWRRALEVERYLTAKNDSAMLNRIAAVGEGEALATSQRADAGHRKVTVAIYKPLVQ
jgi:outer membrane protein OmpA-like peptidoglycan-associated protein